MGQSLILKVVIIGASTAGLYTAYLLARSGVEVELYERNTILGPPRRTLIVTHKLAEVLGFIPEEAVLNKIKHIEVFSRSRSKRLELRKPDLVVEREKILLMLSRLARRAGAKIAPAHEFEDFTQDGKKVSVRLKNLETGDILHTNADILVGADGYQSAVGSALARQNGSSNGKNNPKGHTSSNGHPLTALFQARVALPAEYPDISITRAWFDANLTSYFIWLIPESKYTAALGTIAGDAGSARTCLLRFLDDKKLEPFEFQSAMAPVHSFNHKASIQSPSRNIFTVGDAAGQVKATTIGGLVPGLLGGEALSSALLNGRHYHRELRPLKRELDLHLLARSILNRFRNDDYDKLLSFLNGRLSRPLGLWGRDEFSSVLWSLVFSEPRLVTLGLKAWLQKAF